MVFQTTLRIIKKLQCIKGWREVYYDPLVEHPSCEDLSPTDILWSIFRQGGTLCFVVNLVQTNTISHIYPLNMEDARPFDGPTCKKNMYSFLLACAQDLFMPDEDLFQVADLYKNDIATYVKALNLVEGMLTRYGHSHGIDFTQPFKSQKDLKDENESHMLSLEKASSGKTSMRQKVTDEILVTERNYVSDLEKLKEYMDLVRTDKNRTISVESMETIFSNLDEVLEFQRRFLLDMEGILYKPPGQQLLGRLFVDSLAAADDGHVHDRKFKTYYEFCRNYPEAIQEAKLLEANLEKYDRVIEAAQLPAYLIKPVQRICKYPLLLRELLKYTPESENDYDNIRQGMEAMKKVAANVNEEQRKSENRLTAQNLFNRLDEKDSQSLGDVGELLLADIVPVHSTDLEKEYKVFVFSNVILFCKEGGINKKKNYREIFIKFKIDTAQLANINNASKQDRLLLRVFWKDKDIQNFMLEFRTKEMLTKWFLAIHELIKNNKTTSSGMIPLEARKFSLDSGSDTCKPSEDSGYDLLSRPSDASIKTYGKASKLEKMFGEAPPLSAQASPKSPSALSGEAINRRSKEPTPKFSSESSLSDALGKDVGKPEWCPDNIERVKIQVGSHSWFMRFPIIHHDQSYLTVLKEMILSKISSSGKKFKDIAETFENLAGEDLVLLYIDQENDEIEVFDDDDLQLCFEEARGRSSILLRATLGDY